MATVPAVGNLMGRVQKSGPSALVNTSVSYPRSTSKRLLEGKLTPLKCKITNLVPVGAVSGGKLKSQVLGEVAGEPESGPMVRVGESKWKVPMRCDIEKIPRLLYCVARLGIVTNFWGSGASAGSADCTSGCPPQLEP